MPIALKRQGEGFNWEERQITDKMIMAVPADPSLKQLTEEELMARLEESSAQAKNGDYILPLMS